MIVNPVLNRAFDAGWFMPWTPPSDLQGPGYGLAVDEGWHEWVESELDIEAIRNGYMYDQSYDKNGRPCYWIDGMWQLHDGDRVPLEDEYKIIKHCGRGDHFCRYAESFLRFTKVPLSGQPYRFLDWQRKLVTTLFGWVKRPTDERASRYRRFMEAIIEIAKKNGKSDILSVIACYGTMADFTPKSYCYGAACDRNQARIIFNEAASYARSSPLVQNELMVIDSRSRILHQNSASFFEVLSSESHRNDGIDANYILFDELHRQPNRKLYSVLKRAGQARPQPLRLVITTYGPSSTDGSIWAEVHNGAKAQLEGKRNSWRTLVFIASAEPIPVISTAPAKRGDTRIEVYKLQQPLYVQGLDFDLSATGDDDCTKLSVRMREPARRFQRYIEIEPLETDLPELSEATANEVWQDDHGIARANPSVGVVFDYQRLRDEVEAAKSPEAEAETKQLNFNICAGSGRKFISGAAWLACSRLQLQPKVLRGRPAYGGLDLSFGNDLCAFSLSIPKWDIAKKFEFVDRPRVDVPTWVWVPEDTLDAREEQEEFPYRYWSKQPYFFEDNGCVRIVPGSVIDFALVAADIIEICGLFQMRAIAYDPNMAAFCIPTLESAGMPCVAHRQGGVSMAPPTKAFTNLVYRTLLCHGDNPLLTRSVENAVLHTPDRAGNTYPSKQKSHARIDPLVAAIMAVGFAVSPPIAYDGAYSGEEGAGMWG